MLTIIIRAQARTTLHICTFIHPDADISRGVIYLAVCQLSEIRYDSNAWYIISLSDKRDREKK